MPSITKRVGGYRAQVAVKGVRDSAVFTTKAEAMAWAVQREAEIRKSQQSGVALGKTLSQALDRYETEISAHKEGHRWEKLRMAAIARFEIDGRTLGSIPLSDIDSETLGAWRDKRIKVDGVCGSTSNREITLISHVFSVAHREWKWVEGNPVKDVRRPKESAHRDRRISSGEIERVCLAMGFDGGPVTTKLGCVAVAFLFAIETAMRSGEICSLTQDSINGAVARLAKTKNGTARNVPLSKRALELLTYLPVGNETLFWVTDRSRDALFRKARDRSGVEDLTFHDTRHEAITRLAKKISILDLARMVGHKDLKMLQIYYNESAADIALKLD